MKRCIVLTILLAIISVGNVSAQTQAPNIVLILVDDLGYGDLSSYGATDMHTPAIDGLTASGMRFDRFYANSSVCSPTRTALLSGRYPPMAGVPGVIESGSASDYPALTMDIYPTLLDAAGVPVTHFIDGRSFLPTLHGEDQPWEERYLFFSRREGGVRYNGKTIEAVRHGPWKLLQNSPFAPLELYNLEDDPLETTNLAADEPDVFHRLAAALRGYLQEGGKVPWQRRQ